MFKKNYRSRTLRGKLRVCRFLRANRSLKKNIPYTRLFSLPNMKMMTVSHSSLYIKPDVGSLGIGIFKLTRTRGGFKLRSSQPGKRSRRFHSATSVYRYIRAKRRERMIIQKTVRLDQARGRPYDIRVMVQRKPKGSWTCTGMAAKVGQRGKIVTNYYQGGELMSMESLHSRKRLTAEQGKARIRQLTRKALEVAHTLSAKRSGMREMGVDFAYDRNGRLWVLEVNSNHPQFHPFKKFDRAAYARMMRYARSYGRKSAK
ncbi:YheC/D like ATP-grasp [Paenibacillus sp. UNCCL117]|uniref:YheC/YheD family protein n=1 Tax=unclassified Paenibacillus TaxID=185978 RepID=UPI00088D8C05|nr:MULTISPECIES: YheC/YheD family protein [unclassified Paenibacillus]SDC95883.1 YheC/D like ATP-grasp [Paenibacillus sp. cl123]SFW30168.1 YheC/D like ATP-grasp [Paenibacillus sp. UNCCL117]